MYDHAQLNKRQLFRLIHAGHIKMAGYKKNKVYGTLHCSSGKRMKQSNRVFFRDEAEAIAAGYRPCGHCMKHKKLTR
jgi:methylphosphotriester-DNA--protein-cysteine methyltransferase